MNVSIIPIDGAVYVDGFSFSGLQINAPVNVHALQWGTNKGWIEFADSIDGVKPVNQDITELPAWATAAIAQWRTAKDADDALKNAVSAVQNQLQTTGSQTL
jgi:hypothetical protein